jgi:bisphosphoglycerate-dependent phosphoglycerate mutase
MICEWCGKNSEGIIIHETIVVTNKSIEYPKKISICTMCHGLISRLPSNDAGYKKVAEEKVTLYCIKSKSFPSVKKDKVIPYYNSLLVSNYKKGKKVIQMAQSKAQA